MREVPDPRAVPRCEQAMPLPRPGSSRSMRRTAPASVRLPCCSADNDLENPPREPSHAFATRPTGACENKLPQKLRCIQNDLLSDHSSDREPEDIHLLGAERMDEGDDVARIRGIESVSRHSSGLRSCRPLSTTRRS